jgi:hippurate hydrolase
MEALMDLITEPESWIALGESLLPDMIALRRAIHEEPELGLHLPLTTAKAKAALAGLPLEIVDSTSTTGFMAILRGPANGRTVLLRGDMDALPLTEDTGLEFSSGITGAMHACASNCSSYVVYASLRHAVSGQRVFGGFGSHLWNFVPLQQYADTDVVAGTARLDW